MRLVGELVSTRMRGDLLAFRSILARAEMNRNGDEITVEGIRELAATLPGMPLTYDDHRNPRAVCGHYTVARTIQDDTALETEAVLYAARFPELAAQVREGKLRKSVETHVTRSECLDCSAVYDAEAGGELCSHLGAGPGKRRRRVMGLAAFGGCLVANPAGTGCDIDATSLRMVASVIEEIPELKNDTAAAMPPWLDDSKEESEKDGAAEEKDEDKAKAAAESAEKESAGEPAAEEATASEAASRAKGSGLRLITVKGATHMKVHCNACGEETERADVLFAADVQPIHDELAVTKHQLAEATAAQVAAEAQADSVRAEFDAYKAEIELAAKVDGRLTLVATLIGEERAQASREKIGGFSDENFEFFVETLKEGLAKAQASVKESTPKPESIRGSFGVRGAGAGELVASEESAYVKPTSFDGLFS